ncbi:MAG: glycosyltransferase family 4 protein [Actinomycetota bacterium]|nr:glycosyltransferase family 4 protein [Actinomycetota bacterium]
MRILQVDKFLRRQGGAASYMLDLAERQRAAGHDVEFFAMADDDNLPATHTGSFPPHVELEPPPPGVGAKLRAARTMIWSRAAAAAMDEVVDLFRPEVAHLHNIYHQLSPSILRPLARRNIPIVMTVHDYKLVCPSYQLLDTDGICEACLGDGGGRFHQAALRRCKGGSLGASALLSIESTIHRRTRAYSPVGVLIAPSEFMAAKLRESGPFPDRVRHIPNFVDTDAIEPRTGPGDGIVYVGRLAREKGVDVLIDAVARLEGVHLTIAGSGPERDALVTRAEQAAPGRVRFAGHLDKADVVALVRSSRVAALAARWHENMPMSIVETMAAGVPMVVTDLGGLPDLVDDGRDGFVVPAGDPDALARALGALTGDEARAETMGAAARAKAAEVWSAPAHLEAVFSAYAAAADRLAA